MTQVIKAVALLTIFAAPALPADAETLAIFPVKLLDTSSEARDQSADHTRRQAMMGELFAEGLDVSSVRIEPEQVGADCVPETAECLFDVARDAGADQAMFVSIQKASSLIMNLFVTVADTDNGSVVWNNQLSFRGDTDESWRRAALFVVDELHALPLAGAN